MKRTIISLLLVLTAMCSMAQNTKLQGRSVEGVLPKPIVSINSEGVVVVSIWVDQYGTVQKAEAGADGTTLIDPKVWAAARSAALGAHFNLSADAPALQKGTITYIFKKKETRESVQSEGMAQRPQETNTQDVFTFRGILINGTQERVESELEQLGYYKEYAIDDYLTGEFNGEEVRVYVHTHQGMVDRIKVEFPYEKDEVARVKYNNLISRFSRNDKFTPLLNIPKIPTTGIDDKKASRNLYDATYFQLKEGTNASAWRSNVNSKITKSTGTTVDKISHEELEEYINNLPSALSCSIVGVVWFTFESSWPLYRIVLYYDNLDNRPRGEDL